MLLLICNRELLFIGKRKDEDDMAKSTKTYEERIRALEKKEQESIEATKKLIAQRKELEKRKKAEESKNKNFVEVTKQGKMNLYTPLVSQSDYQAHESQSVLEKLYGNSLKKFVTSLYHGKKISSEEVQDLSEFLKNLEDREE